jgi:replicative DNA helicase
MKRLSLLLMFNVAVVLSAPQDILADHDHAGGDEAAKAKISKAFMEAQVIISMQKPPMKYFESSFLRSVNQNCILEHYKKHGIVDRIPDITAPKKASDIAILVLFTKSCSPKTDLLIEFAFEVFMSYRFIVEAFVHEPEFKEYADMLLCANNYAVNNKYLDPEVYKINHTLPESAEAGCRLMEESVEMEMKRMEESYQQFMSLECTRQMLEDAKKIVLKYGLLIQIELSEGQEKELRENFVKEIHDDEDKIVSCAQKH